MDTDMIAHTVEDFIRRRFAVDSADSEFSREVNLFDYGYVDSFGAVELYTYLEETFDISISDSDLMRCPMNTVSQIATFVAGRGEGHC